MNPEDRLRRMLGKARGDDNVTHSKWDDFATSARRSLRIQRFATAGAALVLVGVLVVGGLAAFNNSGPEGPVTPGGSTSPDGSDLETPSPPPTDTIPSDFEEPPPEKVSREIEMWLVDPTNDTLSWGSSIWEVSEEILLQEVIAILLEGPTSPDVEAGAETEIPEGTRLIDSSVENETATLTLSQEFLDGKGSETDWLRDLGTAQVVFQATQVEGINQVEIKFEGVQGLKDMVFSRNDFGDVAPPIVVNEPKIGSEHTSPLVIEGTANVFEGTVQIELEIEKGQTNEVIGTFTTASCGSGCRGEFSETLNFNVDKPTDARLRVYEESAEDGSRLHEITLPIRLLPSD